MCLVSNALLVVDESAAFSRGLMTGPSALTMLSVSDDLSRSLLDLKRSHGFSGPVHTQSHLHHGTDSCAWKM